MLDLPESPYVDVPQRHRTLRAVFGWSVDLLKPEMQAFLAHLSVFRGGWTEEAAAEVNGRANAVQALKALQERSLVTWANTADGAGRYRLLEPIRELASERLELQAQREAERRHSDFYLRMAETARPFLDGPEQADWLARLGTEHANLRACLDRALAQGDVDRALRLCAGLQPFWWLRGHFAEGRGFSARALDMEGVPHVTRARGNALSGAGVLARRQGDYAEARRLLEEALGVWRELGDCKNESIVLNSLSSVARYQGEYAQARALLQAGLAIACEVDNRRSQASILGNLGVVAYFQGDYEAARAYQTQSLALEEELGKREGIAASLANLGLICHAEGQYRQARTYYEQDLALCRELGDHPSIAAALNNLGGLLCDMQEYTDAQACLEAGLSIREEVQDRQGIASSLHSLGLLAVRRGDPTGARSLLARCLQLVGEIGDKETAPAALEASAELALGEQRGECAIHLFGAAARLRDALGFPLPADQRARQDRVIAQLCHKAGAEGFAIHWAQGSASTFAQAVMYALDASPMQ